MDKAIFVVSQAVEAMEQKLRTLNSTTYREKVDTYEEVGEVVTSVAEQVRDANLTALHEVVKQFALVPICIDSNPQVQFAQEEVSLGYLWQAQSREPQTLGGEELCAWIPPHFPVVLHVSISRTVTENGAAEQERAAEDFTFTHPDLLPTFHQILADAITWNEAGSRSERRRLFPC